MIKSDECGISGNAGVNEPVASHTGYTLIAGLSPIELVEIAAALIAAGGLSGLLAGVFGIGGGAILVPVLYECFRLVGVPLEVRMPLCVGTSLAIIIPTSIASWRAHRLRGTVDMTILKRWIIPIILGVIAGALIARFAPERLFKFVFVFVTGAASARLLFSREAWRFGDDLPRGLGMQIYGAFIGLISTLMGIGGGLFANLVMTFYGRPIHQAVGTSSGLAVLISIPGALGYVYAGWPAAGTYPNVAALQFPLAVGYVSIIGALLMIPAGLICAPLGVALAHRLTKRKLELAFGIYLLLVCIRFVISLL